MNAPKVNVLPKPDALKVGDVVVTPLGRHATITKIRVDGYLDALYVGWPPTLADVILRPDMLKRVSHA